MKYRREIDGLRAFAVLPVILFHAGFKVFEGGFVGVDVFFVISGYLITTIILSDMNKGEFSIVTFYERRARRILPALFFVMLCCLPFAWLWLPPHHLKDFCQSLTAVSGFYSNILFWLESGYFETAGELKPLLHTWSLAVEEQYYVLFPLFLMVLWKFRKRWIFGALLFVGISSFLFAQWGAYHKPVATFFLLPTRVWELVIGALIAFYFIYKQEHSELIKLHKKTSEVLGFVGFLLILFAIFAFDKDTPFPSSYALIPTIGTALIIIFSTHETAVGRVLGIKPMVGIGLVSYSAYLWHVPLFVFARHRSLQLDTVLLLILSFTSILLAYVSWRFVESPFRNKNLISRKSVFTFAITGSIFFATVGLAGHYSDVFEKVLEVDKVEYLDYFENSPPQMRYSRRKEILSAYRSKCDFYDIAKYVSGNPTRVPIEMISDECYVRDRSIPHSVFIWGDSHAEQLYHGLKMLVPEDWQILQVTSSANSPKLDAKENKEDYREFSNWFAYKTIIDTKPDVVIVGQNDGHNLTDMIEIGSKLKSIGVKKIIFTGPTPHWTPSLPEIVVHSLWNNTPQKTNIGLNERILALDKNLMNNFPQSESVRYVSIIDNFCDSTGCRIYLGDDRKTGITAADYGHLTPVASSDFVRNSLLREIIGQ